MTEVATTDGYMNYDDLAPQDYRFTYKNKEYVLVEPPEAGVIAYRNTMTKGVKLDANTKPTSVPESLHEADSVLVSHSVTTAEGKPVSLDTVRGWSSRVVKDLAKRAKVMGGLEEQVTVTSLSKQIVDLQRKRNEIADNGTVEDGVKNSSSATADTSV
jgi:hypothetical protein